MNKREHYEEYKKNGWKYWAKWIIIDFAYTAIACFLSLTLFKEFLKLVDK